MIDAPLKSCGQKNLADDGKRVWDDEIRSRLDHEYDDWRDPKRTYMVPPSFQGMINDKDVGRKAEEKFYNLLHEQGQNNNEPMFVVHSVDFSEHVPGSGRERSWVMGESDFVVIHRMHGPIFFQVKATKTGKNYKEAEEQIYKDKVALENFLRKMRVKGNISTRRATEPFKNFPGFVVMPNCPRSQLSVCIQDNVLCQEDCSSPEAFSNWWNEKIESAEHPPHDQTVFEHLVMRFVGLAHAGHCLSCSIDKSHGVLVFKTREQLNALLNSTPKQCITGPAGCGKTWLLIKKVERLAENALINETGEKILVVCYNKPLSKMFSTTFTGKRHWNDLLENANEDLSSVVRVVTFDALLYEITKVKSGDSDQKKRENVAEAVKLLEKGTNSIQQYDHIFVDECQDLCGDKWPILFEKLQKDANDLFDDSDDEGECKHIWFLYDTNQYLRLSDQQRQFFRKNLKNTTRLSSVLRNTGNVFNQSRKYYKSKVTGELQLGHSEDGLPIEMDDSLTSTKDTGYQGAEAIKKHISKLHLHNVEDSDICVLVRNMEIRDELKSKLRHLKVKTQDAEELFDTTKDQNKVIVESIWRFKGLESKVVILYNPPFFEDKDWTVKTTNEILYTAVSRCFCYLVVITTKQGCKALQSLKGLQEKTGSAGTQKKPAMLHSSEDLASAKRSQCNALFREDFGKRAIDSQYESGPPESLSYKHFKSDGDDDDDGKDEPHISPPKISRMEEATMYRQYELSKRSSEERPRKVPGCDLLEPGDPAIKDSIRNNAFSLLSVTVEQNLQHIPGPSNQVSSSDVTSVVVQIEYEVYCKRRREHNQRNYTKDLRILKREIEKCNKSQTIHETVEKAKLSANNS